MQPDQSAPYQNVTTTEVKAMLDRGDSVRLIDVREPEEYAVAHIEGAELLPMSQAGAWIESLQPNEQVVIMCHHGGRSQQVAHFLATQRGMTNVANMLGGIEDWSRRIDPSVPRY